MSKITRRSYKRKKIVMGVALFGAIALVSTGFAAWVLSASSSAEQGMNMKVGNVDDNSMKVEIDGVYKTSDVVGVSKASAVAEGVGTYEKFSFNPKQSDTTGRVRWGSGQEETDEPENLSLTIFGHVNQAQNLQTVENHGLTILLKGTIPSQLNVASNVGTYSLEGNAQNRQAYIGLPACFTAAQDINYTLEGEGTKTAYFRYDVAFTWGAQFGGENPSEYYYEAGISIGMDHVKAVLRDMYSLINAVESFTVEITAIPN